MFKKQIFMIYCDGTRPDAREAPVRRIVFHEISSLAILSETDLAVFDSLRANIFIYLHKYRTPINYLRNLQLQL
jgi:hypothetical protein